MPGACTARERGCTRQNAVSTLDRARDAMRAELAEAFLHGDRGRTHAAATWLRATGIELVEVYEVLLDASRGRAPELATTADEKVARHRVQEDLRELAAQLRTPPQASRGTVLVVVPGSSLHAPGVTALVHVLEDAGWSVVAAPELGLDDVGAQLERIGQPAALLLGLRDAALVPDARAVVRSVRARWPGLRVVVGGLAQQRVPDLASAVGAHAAAGSLRETLAALDGSASPLSPRELAVLTCVARGMSNPDTAEHLGVASATVKTHLDRVYAKLGTSDRTATVAMAMRRGWIA